MNAVTRPFAAPPRHSPDPRRCLLVVEDSVVVRTLLAETLSQAGYDVVNAEDGQAALRCLDGRPLHGIVCDLGMPRIDGQTFIGLVRAHPKYGRVPVLVVSYDSRAETRQAVREAGAQAFLGKPCHTGDLLDAVNRLCT